MANEIESISQGNYILHNIDAKKLYVQEPLFTANSGDAVYVGWRPDETVLFENWDNSVQQLISGATRTFNLTENVSAFEQIRLTFRHSYGLGGHLYSVMYLPGISGINTQSDCMHGPAGAVGGLCDVDTYVLSGDKICASGYGRYRTTTAGAFAVDLTARGSLLQQVVGINRKENA